MAQVLIEKPVLFSGIWRPRHGLDERFLRTVNQQFLQRPGARAKWQLTADGLTILVSQTESGKQGQTDEIPIRSIQEVSVSPFNRQCLLTLYQDSSNRTSALVCLCESEQDTFDIMQTFHRHRVPHNSDGLQAHPGQSQIINWTLKTERFNDSGTFLNRVNGLFKKNATSLQSEEVKVGSMLESMVDNEKINSVMPENRDNQVPERDAEPVDCHRSKTIAVQAEFSDNEVSDDESSVSATSLQSLKDELHSMSREIRDAKTLIENTPGINRAESYRLHNDTKPADHDPRDPGVKSPLMESKEKRVNFAEVPTMVVATGAAFDIRSVGMRTGKKSSEMKQYDRRHGAPSTPMHRKQHFPVMRNRSLSASSAHSQSTPPGYHMHRLASYDGGSLRHATQLHRPNDVRVLTRLGTGTVPSRSLHGNAMAPPGKVVYVGQAHGIHQNQKIVVLPHTSAIVTSVVKRESTERRPRQWPANEVKDQQSSAEGGKKNGKGGST